MDKYIIAASQENQRLDKTLVYLLPGLARHQIQKMIKSGRVLIGNRARNAHYVCRIGDEITILPISFSDKRENEEKNKAAEPIPIIHKGADFIIVNKPAGISVHGPAGKPGATLIERLVRRFPDISRVGENPDRPGIVHRLDKEVSGLLVVARTQAAYDSLVSQFKNRSMKKEYSALVYGRINSTQGTIDFPLARSRRSGKTAALPATYRGEKNPAGRPAETKYEIATAYHNFTLLKIITKTGRTHQIRAHLAAYGHPLVGDDLYGTKKTRIKNKKLALGRVFLVANKLSFADAAGETQRFTIRLPGELINFLKKIK